MDDNSNCSIQITASDLVVIEVITLVTHLPYKESVAKILYFLSKKFIQTTPSSYPDLLSAQNNNL